MVGRVGGDVGVRSDDVALDERRVVLVRGIPRGLLEQVVFRVDVLHALAAAGVRTVNTAHGDRADRGQVPRLDPARARRPDHAPHDRVRAALSRVEAFAELGGDVIVKPLFGSMGFGMVRVDDPDVAERVFRALELERAVYYLEETLPHEGRDVRALVVGERLVAAIERTGDGWRTNLPRREDARAQYASDSEQERLCVAAVAALGADYAGVDLLRGADGRDYVLEVNGIPGWQGVERSTVSTWRPRWQSISRPSQAEGAGLRAPSWVRSRHRAGLWPRARPPPRLRRERVGRRGRARPRRRAGPVRESASRARGPARHRGRRRSDAREVEHDHLIHARLDEAAPAPRPPRAGRGRGSRETTRSPRRSRLSTSGASGSSARSRPSAAGSASVSVPITTRAAPSSSSGRTRRRRDTGVDDHTRLGARAARASRCGGLPAIASRSAT